MQAIVESKQIYEKTIGHFLAPVKSLLEDDSVSEIMINGPGTVFLERAGRIERTDCKFVNQEALWAAARNIAEFSGRDIGGRYHSMDARLPDGSRVHVLVPPSSRQGVCITIRKFKKSTFGLQQLVEWDSITQEAGDFLSDAVKSHKNIVISGGTGTGKTSMLNALSSCIPTQERIIVIEDSSELQLQQEHVLYLEAQPPDPNGEGQVTIRDLFVDSLRMRPDRIVVGEVRRGEALDLIQSMISGHSGSLTTVHANTPRDALIRLETLCLMSDVSLPVHVARMQVASAVNVIVQIERLLSGKRQVSVISVCDNSNSSGDYSVQQVFVRQPGGKLKNVPTSAELRPLA